MTRFLIAVAAVTIASTVRAGGPPPVYVVIDEVITEPSDKPERVTIRGSFIRVEKDHSYDYGKPVEGVVCLSLDPKKADACRAEWKTLAKAAGTGKAVAVGICSEAGAFLKVKIHKPDEKPTTPDGTYTPGHLTAKDANGTEWWTNEPAVKAVQAFAKERKDAKKTADRE
jgi:hypothetical protein